MTIEARNRIPSLIIALIMVWHGTSAQIPNRIFSGYVRDYATRQALPGATIRTLGTSKGTATNGDGAFRLLADTGSGTFVASFVGYVSDTIVSPNSGGSFEHIFYLQASVIPMSGVFSYGDEPDPAEEIIAKAAEKKHAAMSRLHSYSFKAYTKTTMSTLRKGNVSDTMITAIMETQTDGYCRLPDTYKEIITARRQTAGISSQLNMFTVGRMPNFNDDIIAIERYSVIGPTSHAALDYYSFTMLDTLSIDNIPVYRIRMIPKSTTAPLFDGIISIAERSFMVMSVDVSGNDALNLSPANDFHIQQQFALYDNTFWMPISNVTTFTIPFGPIFIKQVSQLTDYALNRELPDNLFDNFALTTSPEADKRDSLYWNSTNTIPFTQKEKEACKRIDSTISHASPFMKTTMFLFQLPFIWNQLPFTAMSDFVHFNRVEGLYLGAGLKLPPLINFHPVLRFGYGLADERLKYACSLEYHFTSSSRTPTLGFDVHRILRYREEDAFTSDFITATALIEKEDPVDYYLASGWQISGQTDVASSLRCSLTLLDEHQESVAKTTDFSIFYQGLQYRTNPPIIDGNLHSLSFGLTFDTRQILETGEVADISQNTWDAKAEIEQSSHNILESDYNFTRYAAIIKRHQLLRGTTSLDACCSLGYSTGALPPQRLFDIIARSSVISVNRAMKTVGEKEFAGDKIVVLQLDYNMGSTLFRWLGVPVLRKLDFIAYSGAAWTDISAESAAIQPMPVNTTPHILTEAGAGFGRVLGFLRIDFTWRLTNTVVDNFHFTLSSTLF